MPGWQEMYNNTKKGNPMALTKKQTGVLIGMAIGLAISLNIVLVGAWYNPFSFSALSGLTARLAISIQCSVLPALFLIASVARLARHRFFTPEDIDGGGGLSHDSKQALLLQTLLQNTLEQLLIAVVIYLAWAVMMPADWMSVVPLAAISFALGRVLFFAGYKGGAPSRALGFALTFYPSALMLITIIGQVVWKNLA